MAGAIRPVEDNNEKNVALFMILQSGKVEAHQILASFVPHRYDITPADQPQTRRVTRP